MSITKFDHLSHLYHDDMSARDVLTREAEFALAREYQRTQSPDIARQLVEGNLRFVAKIAREYAGYGFAQLDLVQEGNVGLTVALEKFDPSLGNRLASYAVWWIRAYMRAYVMRNWSLVKLGTTQAQRKLFFKVRSERLRVERELGPDKDVTAQDLAERFGLRESEVVEMEARMSESDVSIDAPAADDSSTTYKDLLPSSDRSPEDVLANHQVREKLHDVLEQEKPHLNIKERYVLENRILNDEPSTLKDIGDELQVSRERVRQIECRVIGKLRSSLMEALAA